MFEIRKFWKISFGKSFTKMGTLCTPSYKFIWPGCLPVASFFCLNRFLNAFMGLSCTEKTGYWKATGPNKFRGRGTQVTDFCRGFSKGKFPNIPENKQKKTRTLITGGGY